MTRHCRGARVPRTLGQQCACVHVRSCEWRGVPVTSSGDPPGLAPIRIYIEWYSHQWCMYTGVYMRARGDQHVDLEPALSGSHRPHQHHSITRGTLWNHLPNHLVTSTQRNADCPPHAQFSRASPAVSSAAEGEGGGGEVKGSKRGFFLSLSPVQGGTNRRDGDGDRGEGGTDDRLRRLLCFATRDPASVLLQHGGASLCHRVSLPC